MTQPEVVSRWSRRFVIVGVIFLLTWSLGTLLGFSEQASLTIGLLGFVFHTVFGKAYSLIPTYFDRDIATVRFLPFHFGFAVFGTTLLAGGLHLGNSMVTVGGAVLWCSAVAIFVGTIGWSIRTNLTGSETATSEAKRERRVVDRIANLFMPIALAYLVVGSYELLATVSGLPPVLDGYWPRAIHLLAAGTGALLVFAVGFRLFPRFLVAKAPTALVVVVLPAGAVAPALLASNLLGGQLFQAGAVLQLIAILGFAIAYWWMWYQTDRTRVGFYGVLICTFAGIAGVSLGVMFAFDGLDHELLQAHMRLNILGFLGLAIIGVSYQFYPPNVGTYPLIGDRSAFAVLTLLTLGLVLEVLAVVFGSTPVQSGGQILVLGGVVLHLYILTGVTYGRYGTL